MDNILTHFAIHADDTSRAVDFYKAVFNWQFNNYGDADFQQIQLGKNANPIGAIQHRKYSSLDKSINGFECSINVEDVEHTAEAIVKAGGKILMPKTEIPHVGWIIKFLDIEGNLVCVVEYFSL